MTSLATATIQRLQGNPAFKLVGSAREFGASLVTPPIDKMPAVFVLPYEESYGDNELLNGVRQSGPQKIALVLQVAVRAAVGANIHDPFEAPAAALKASLLGWQPDASDGEVVLVSGHLLEPKPTHLAYQYVFQRNHTERN